MQTYRNSSGFFCQLFKRGTNAPVLWPPVLLSPKACDGLTQAIGDIKQVSQHFVWPQTVKMVLTLTPIHLT